MFDSADNEPDVVGPLLYPATRDIPAGKAISKATPFRCGRPSPPWLEESVGEGGRMESRCVARRAVDERAVREVVPEDRSRGRVESGDDKVTTGDDR